MRSPGAAAVLLAAGLLRAAAAAQSAAQPAAPPPFVGILDEHPAIQYAARQPTDRVAALDAQLSAGTAALSFAGPAGYLTSVLQTLGLARESQVLVFSKTGIQAAMTGPETPRALYFDDSLVVGYIPGARVIEIAAHDPQLGVVFYTLPQQPSPAPRFERRTLCLNCHVSASTLEVPGLIARSHVLDHEGGILPQLGGTTVDHRTAVAERWGGWFVTGTYAAPAYAGVAHKGNVTVTMHPSSGPVTSSNEVFVRWLAARPEDRGYASHDSDIVSLLLFDHQARAVNLMTRLNWEARVAAESGLDWRSPAVIGLVDELADYFLFVDEAPLPAGIVAPKALVERFGARGRRDRQGRSLRDLDLDRRLLKYPCSYMIETAAFDHLPAPVKAAVYERLRTILNATDRGGRYAHLSVADRRAILEILRDTTRDFH